MTQALNLANFANFLNTSGQVSASGLQTGITVPNGIIAMWSGLITAIPAGWVLCDGTGSTPDLRNMFVVGAGSTYAVGATGGSANAIVVSHTHTATVTDPGHFHAPNSSSNFWGNNAFGGSPSGGPLGSTYGTFAQTSTQTTGVTVANTSTGSSGTNANLPPYFALAFIMKT
jgi:hypothetical protein